jgi:putative transposase
MSTYTQILYQIVFGSKNCIPFLTTQNQGMLFNYMAGIAQNKKCVPYCIGGHSNHLHLIIHLHPTESLSDFIRDIKKGANDWMLENNSNYFSFTGWQIGYGAFTYDYSSKHKLINYVKSQVEHHRKVTFQEELIKLLEEFEIKYDLKYLFV